MTVQRSWGPQINIGKNPPLGHRFRPLTLGVASPPPYVSGVNENPDAGPETSFAGFMLRDFRILSSPDGNVGLVPGGYPAQDFGFLMSAMGLTVDFAPSPSESEAICPRQGTLEERPLSFIDAEGLGTRVLEMPLRVRGFRHHVIPRGCVQIGDTPRYHSYGTSGALQAWIGNTTGRCLAINSTTSLLTQHITIHGYDVYGFRILERLQGPENTTIVTKHAFKWVLAIIPSATNPDAAISVGTSNVFEFPLRADSFCDTLIWWNDVLVTSAVGFTRADPREPHEMDHGSVRGTYQVQSSPNGQARLQVRQAVRAVNSDTVAGTFGVPMFEDDDEWAWDAREGGPGLTDEVTP